MECARGCFLEQYIAAYTQEQTILDLVSCIEGLMRGLEAKDPLEDNDHNITEL